MAAEHLISKGYKKIGMVTAHAKSEKYQQREQGFKDALEKHNMPIHEDYIASGITRKHAGFSEEAGYEAVHILKNRDKMPEALFCSNDAQALGALHALAELEMKVPDDIAIIGYDNIKISKYLDLTTIDQKMMEIGNQATQRIVSRIYEETEENKHITVKPSLIERKSTRRP